MQTPEAVRQYENDADLSIAVLWNCATQDDRKFSLGVPTESVFTSYYSYAYGAAFVAVSKWLLADYGVTHGYGKHYKPAIASAMAPLAEAILAEMSDCGPEPVRQLRRMAVENNRHLNPRKGEDGSCGNCGGNHAPLIPCGDANN